MVNEVNEMAVRVLAETDRVLTERGWCQYAYFNSGGQHCTVGALRSVKDAMVNTAERMADRRWRWWLLENRPEPGLDPVMVIDGFARAYAVTEELVREEGCCSIISWNDRPHRTIEDVHLLLKRAAERLENDE